MGQSSLRVLAFQPKQTPRYLNSKHLPSCGQQQLSEIMVRFDRLMLEHPNHAMTVLHWADQMLRIFNV